MPDETREDVPGSATQAREAHRSPGDTVYGPPSLAPYVLVALFVSIWFLPDVSGMIAHVWREAGSLVLAVAICATTATRSANRRRSRALMLAGVGLLAVCVTAYWTAMSATPARWGDAFGSFAGVALAAGIPMAIAGPVAEDTAARRWSVPLRLVCVAMAAAIALPLVGGAVVMFSILLGGEGP